MVEEILLSIRLSRLTDTINEDFIPNSLKKLIAKKVYKGVFIGLSSDEPTISISISFKESYSDLKHFNNVLIEKTFIKLYSDEKIIVIPMDNVHRIFIGC